MRENAFDSIKKIFTYSKETVLFLNDACELVWQNRSLSADISGLNFRTLLQLKPGTEESGETRYCTIGVEVLAYRVMYVPEMDGTAGIYVVQMEQGDALFNLMRCTMVRNFLENQSGTIRQAVTGISTANELLRQTCAAQNTASVQELLNISSGNCYRLLRSVLHTSELLRYSYEMQTNLERIEVGQTLQTFIDACQSLLRNGMELTVSVDESLYVAANMERMISCLLSLFLLAHENDAERNCMSWTAARDGDMVCIRVTTDSMGTDARHEQIFSQVEPLHPEIDARLGRYLIEKFCVQYHAELLRGENGSYCLRMPYVMEESIPLVCHSSIAEYKENRFSKYHIALAELAGYQFFE